MSNPYRGLKDYQFWWRSVSNVEPHLFDPVTSPKVLIKPGDRVATAGSCFAQNISRKLHDIGFNYFVAEDGKGLPETERTRRSFGVFSARYGNIYTTAQLLQLLEEACGDRTPAETVWRRPDGRYVDALRPQVEPDGFADAAEVAAARAEHLIAVRRVFLECDVFVFTLGLTEAWRSKQDGSVFPLAPGVVAGEFSPHRYEAVNFGVGEVEHDLRVFLERLRSVNPRVRVVLTVSPVPLIATFEDRSVVCSTTYSKAVLRVVADMVSKPFDWVDYFPSFEIITGSNAAGRYFGDDYREVNDLGVAHAMRSFVANYVRGPGGRVPDRGLLRGAGGPSGLSGIVCDEETIAMAGASTGPVAARRAAFGTALHAVKARFTGGRQRPV